MNRDVPRFLIILPIIIGIILFFGSTTYKVVNNYNHRNYIETTATFIKVNNYCSSDDGTPTYNLLYKYNANGKEYSYITNYCTSFTPKIGNTIKIKYNPSYPSQSYSTFDTFSIFSIIGAAFIFISLILLFSEWTWFRDILIFLGTASLMIIFMINNFYTGYFIIILIILGTMCFASMMDFISLLKNNKFNPLMDIKNEINNIKRINLNKKESKYNLSAEEILIKHKKRKRIIRGC